MAVRSYGHDIDYSYICINCDLDIKDRILVKGQNIPTIVGSIIQIRQGGKLWLNGTEYYVFVNMTNSRQIILYH